ncbi:MAG TPA: glycosyltransferase family 87 protein [Verrucomicrobiaceae bacterium]|jgi:hypothetical protein
MISSVLDRMKAIRLSRAERWMLISFFVVSAALTVQPVVKTIKEHRGAKDYDTWDEVSRAVRNDKALYKAGHHAVRDFYYPPAIATLFYTPLSYAGLPGMVLLLCLFTCLGHLVSLFLSVYFATGQLRAPPRIWLIAFVVGVPFVVDLYFLGQLNMTLLAVMLCGFLALEKQHPVMAGTLFAMSASAKAFPFSVIGYLVWRRHWTATISMLGALALILVFLPAPVRGFERNWRELCIWTDSMLLHNSGDALANQPTRAFRYGNQTLMSVVHRLTRPLPVGREDEGDLTVNLIDVSSTTSFLIFAAIAGSMCLAFVMLMPPRDRRTLETNAIEYCVVLLLIVIFSPKAGSYYYCWTIPGFTLVASAAMHAPKGSSRRRWIVIGLALSILVMSLALTQNFDRRPQGMGATLWGAVLLFVTLLGLLWDKRRQLPASRTVPAGV